MEQKQPALSGLIFIVLSPTIPLELQNNILSEVRQLADESKDFPYVTKSVPQMVSTSACSKAEKRMLRVAMNTNPYPTPAIVAMPM